MILTGRVPFGPQMRLLDFGGVRCSVNRLTVPPSQGSRPKRRTAHLRRARVSASRLTFDTHQTAHAPAKVAPTDGGYGGHLPEVTPESVPHAWSRIVKGQVVENEKVTGSSVQNRTGSPAA